MSCPGWGRILQPEQSDGGLGQSSGRAHRPGDHSRSSILLLAMIRPSVREWFPGRRTSFRPAAGEVVANRGRQVLRIGFGVLRILDGLLQAQSAMPLGDQRHQLARYGHQAGSGAWWDFAAKGVDLRPGQRGRRGRLDPGRDRDLVDRRPWPWSGSAGWPAWAGAWPCGSSARRSAASSSGSAAVRVPGAARPCAAGRSSCCPAGAGPAGGGRADAVAQARSGWGWPCSRRGEAAASGRAPQQAKPACDGGAGHGAGPRSPGFMSSWASVFGCSPPRTGFAVNLTVAGALAAAGRPGQRAACGAAGRGRACSALVPRTGSWFRTWAVSSWPWHPPRTA